ncbi:hypothetical protein EJ05DRAFT_509783 [Pseudovirgaria hyperparasitica]|uniref:Zn(2)-C6 fungal-type domain-containing protein n=1 Tax=Pseudovirgaria hyperparasitica TaxID=470096 RepID=A0A6A6W8B6_9PEZI|nr:uncharacterized protein EJ05DRAFT_509783 [Pseudovirgaria hyperparasitica]KAF2758893.1 hypothetical protein EJ05DRAFT_509783 [Pseudovirgaria hyperparasitica]
MESSARPLFPGTPWKTGGSGSSDGRDTPLWELPKKRKDLARLACDSCRKKKVKCDAQLPKCTLCQTHNRTCNYAGDPGITRTESLKRKNESLQQRVEVLEKFMQFLRSRPEPEVLAILQRMKTSPGNVDLSTLMDFVSFGDLLVGLNGNGIPGHQTPKRSGASPTLAELASKISNLSDTDQARFLQATHEKLDTMTHGSPSPAPVSSATTRRFDALVADPIVEFDPSAYTAVTTDRRLASHLVSLFITWDHTYSVLIPFQLFIRDLKNGQSSAFTNKFLVNMVLSCACLHASADSMKMGSGIDDANVLSESFFQEAKAHWDAELGRSSLANVQALHLMHLRYGILGQDKMGNLVTNQVIAMSHNLNLHNGAEHVGMSFEERQGRRIIAWGLFSSNATTYLAYLKRSSLPTTKALRPDPVALRIRPEEWTPYPSISTPIPANRPTYFEARCDLGVLTCEALEFISTRNDALTKEDANTAKSIFDKLSSWKSNLEEGLRPDSDAPPYVFTLHMLYHVVELVLSGIFRTGSTSEDQKQSELVYLKAATNFGTLISRHRRSYGSKRGCPGLLYFACVCLSALLSLVIEHKDLANLIHEVLLVAVNLSHRVKIGRGMLRVMAEQVEAFPPETVKPETSALFRDVKVNIWKPGDHQSYSSAWQEFSGGMSGLTSNQDMKVHELTSLLEALSAKESEGSPR